MILSLSVIAGLLASLVRARVGRRRLTPPDFSFAWLAVAAIILQTATLRWGSDKQVALGLVTSQSLLLVVVWFNRSLPGMSVLGVGLLLNLLVIVLNGGLMPITPEMVGSLGISEWQPGQRLGATKDIVLPVANTRLWVLSDRFFLRLPSYSVAYSIGDVLIAAGAFWLMWSMSSKSASLQASTNGRPYQLQIK